MSILSCSKASLRGSQPFPDPAFSFQPHGSFPLSSPAPSFWCLWVWGVFFSPLSCIVSVLKQSVFPQHVYEQNGARCAVAEGRR